MHAHCVRNMKINLDAEENYQSAYKLFKEAQKLNDTQASLVQRWFSSLNYVRQRLEGLLHLLTFKTPMVKSNKIDIS